MGELYRLDFPNGKSYIGMTTTTARKRFQGHAAQSTKSKTPLYNAWRKFGAPRLVVLSVIESEDLPATEERAIKIYRTLIPFGYNLLESSSSPPMCNPEVSKKLLGHKHNLGRRWTTTQREKIISKLIGNKFSAGVSPSKETRMLLSASSTGRKHKDESRAKVSAAQKGRKRTDAEKELHRQLAIARWKDEEFKQNQKEKHKTQRHSEETKARMRISQKLRREREAANV